METEKTTFENTERLLKPFWEGGSVWEETVLLLSENGEAPRARLFFRPDKIIEVKAACGGKIYSEGTDWTADADGNITAAAGSDMPFMTRGELVFPDYREGKCFEAKAGGGYVLFRTEGYFHKRQLTVTYTHSDSWTPDLGLMGGDRLARFKKMLAEKSSARLCFYGDSITTGCDSSKMHGLPPFMPGWPDLVHRELERRYETHIEKVNTAVGGMNSDWGVENAWERLGSRRPDLAVIAFGMNDGTQKMSPEKFKANITEIKKQALNANPNAEFLLVSTTTANPETRFDGLQREYYSVLLECAGPGDAVVNMTALHDTLLSRKSFQDMTGNNINHPNDFLIRLYAQAILEAFK